MLTTERGKWEAPHTLVLHEVCRKHLMPGVRSHRAGVLLSCLLPLHPAPREDAAGTCEGQRGSRSAVMTLAPLGGHSRGHCAPTQTPNYRLTSPIMAFVSEPSAQEDDAKQVALRGDFR